MGHERIILYIRRCVIVIRAKEQKISRDVQRGLVSIRAQLGNPQLLSNLARLLAATGEPVTVEQWAASGGWDVAEVQAELARHPSVEWDDRGRIAGFGLTLRPTPHKLTFDGKTVYGWCASDVLLFPVLLGRSGVAESRCPITGRLIRVEVSPKAVIRVEPPEAVVSTFRPTERVADVRAEMCALGLFFSSLEAVAPWLETHPEVRVSPVSEDFAVHRQILEELGWAAALEAQEGDHPGVPQPEAGQQNRKKP